MKYPLNALGLWFFTDFGQFYISDPDTEPKDDSGMWTPEASERSLAVGEGVVGVSILDFFLVRGLFQVFASEPSIPMEAWAPPPDSF